MNTKEVLQNLQHEQELSQLRTENALLKKELSTALERMVRKTGKVVRASPVPTFKKHQGDITRAICCDLHGAKMHKQAAGSFIADCKALQPDEILLLGDMVDVGGFLALHHVMGYVAESSYSYDDDIAATNGFLDDLAKACPRASITYIEGNHENRVERWALTMTLRHQKDAEGLRRRNAPEFLLKLQERNIPYIRMSQLYDNLSLHGTIRRGMCYFTHGSFLKSQNAARDAVARLSGNVVFGNTHRADVYMGHRVNVGIIGGFNPGCLCELQPVWQNTNPTDWTHGYALQFVSGLTQQFLHINIPIVKGHSLLVPFLDKIQ